MQVGDIVRLKVEIGNRSRMKIKVLGIVPIEEIGNPDLNDRALCYRFDQDQRKFEKWFNLVALEITE